MTASEYIDVLSTNYFEGYLREGGSAFKMVVSPSGAPLKSFSLLLYEKVSEAGGLVLRIDAVGDKIHFVDKLFFAVARCIAWDAEAAKFVHRHIVPGGTGNGAHSTVQLSEKQRPDIGAAIKKNVLQDYAYCHEFRTALTHLCLSRLTMGNQLMSPFAPQVQEWLTGAPVPIAALKPAMIFRKVQRSTARHMLYSTFRFLRQCGYSFVVLEIDVGRYADSSSIVKLTSGYSYTPAACLELYELMRQFIDDMERFDSTMIVVTAPNTIVTDQRRGINRYQALGMRLWSDMRIRNAENPMAPLMRLL
jgi:hypothetical protein